MRDNPHAMQQKPFASADNIARSRKTPATISGQGT